MYEVLDQIFIASTLEEANGSIPEIVQISEQPLFERSSVFIAEDIYSSYLFDCTKKNGPEMYKCEECGFEVYLKVNLKVHMEMVHRLGIPITMKSFCIFSDENYNMSTILKCYNCENCEFTTHSLLVLFKHQSTHHKFKKKRPTLTQIAKESFISLKKLTQRKRVYSKSDDGKRFNCDQCTFITKCKYQLKKHIQINHPLPEDFQLYACDQCSFKSINKCRFDSHKLRHLKNGDELLKCNFCCYTTKKKHRMNAHVRYKHTSDEEVPKFFCSYCPYWAKQKANLNEHILVKHTSEENINWFLCELCSFKSKTRTNLRKHMIKHSENRFLLCEMCSTQFKRLSSLKKHMLCKHNIKM